MLDWIQFLFTALLIIASLFTIFVAILGTYRFHFVLNRMHTASIADTLGLLLAMAGMIIAYGLQFASLKILLIIVFMWIASPVSSHLVSQLETLIDPDLNKHLDIENWIEREGEHNGDL